MTIHAPALPAGSIPTTPVGTPPDPRLRCTPLMRRVEIAALMPSGEVVEGSRLVPSLPPFEEAFSAFARGTLLAGPRGVRDLGQARREAQEPRRFRHVRRHHH